MQVIVVNPVFRKFDALAPLSSADRRALALVLHAAEPIPAHHDLVREGSRPSASFVVVTGFACRHKILASGARQITDYLLPGDWCELQSASARPLDHSVGTLSACLVARIPDADLEALCRAHPTIAEALRWFRLVNESTLREWLVNVGQRSADQRIAHLFCELLVRLEAVGLPAERTFDFPLTQQDLADTTGLSVVHVNRILQGLRQAGLIRLKNRTLAVLDWHRLRDLAHFHPTYLDLGRARDERSPVAAG